MAAIGAVIEWSKLTFYQVMEMKAGDFFNIVRWTNMLAMKKIREMKRLKRL